MDKTTDRIANLAKKLSQEHDTQERLVTVSGVTTNAKAKVVQSLLDNPRFDTKKAVFWFVDSKKFPLITQQFAFWNNEKVPTTLFPAGSVNLQALAVGRKPGLAIINQDVLSKYFPSPTEFADRSLLITKERQVDLTGLISFLVESGYELGDTAGEIGYFAHRGAIVEVFPPDQNMPIRLELEGDNVIRLESFDPKKKKGLSEFDEIAIVPAKCNFGKSSILKSIASNENALIIYDDTSNFPTTKLRRLVFKTFATGKIRLDFLPTTLYYGNFQLLATDLGKFSNDFYETTLYTPPKINVAKTLGEIKRLDYQTADIDFPIGYIDTLSKKIVLGPQEIFGTQKEKEEKRPKADTVFLTSLKPGDYVVHIDHGVGKFIGMRQHLVDEGMREYYVLEYAEGDRLSVPVEYADKIDRYVGKSNPTIHRLHGANWHQAKRRIKAKTREIAGELLKLYAAREGATGHSYVGDSPQQIELERSFKYEDTPGQRQVTEEIKRDMENEKPMDRLLVGDVGYGKTEISVRAAFKATQSNKQVAFLCPTTVLAEQHYKTYKKRFANFPLKVEVLSRFKTPAQQRKVIEDIKTGDVDIVIGTHRLLSKDIKFKDLGLIILDEEQRFGVEHKEKLKKLRANVDVLAMSATPIPRTLHFSLSGLRNISTIDTPPPGRQPIETQILPYNESKMAKAIRAEMKRNGQIYFLHNRVETIDAFAKRLQELVPEARIGVAHGQLPEKKLSTIMHDFYHHKYDILVCSTIIESGLDIKNVNTLIVDEATKFGLSQLYQLRGRIGRGSVKAYAYFFYQSKKLKGRAKERLEALLEAKELGAGFQLAMRDLEIRGAGNLLGKEQHGSINAIGLSLYSRLLHQAVEELKHGKELPPQLEVTIDLPLDAYIPKGFFATEEMRLRTYKELASVESQEEMAGSIGRLISKSRSCYNKNDLPEEIKNLLTILQIKLLAQEKRILSIDTVLKKKGEDRKRYLNVTFAEDFSDERFYEIMKNNAGWERRDERTIRVATDLLDKPWISGLQKFLLTLPK